MFRILQREMNKHGMYEIFSILQLGIGSLVNFVGFDTHSFILESVTTSVNRRDPARIDKYAGYYGLAVSHVVYAVANLFAPILISYMHPKWSLLIGSFCFTLYNAGFLYLNTYYFYISAFIMGTGFAVFYCAQGCYVYEHSTEKHLARNASIAWAVTCLSFTLGGIILLLTSGIDQVTSSEGHQEYSDHKIRVIFGIFVACSLLANVILGFLPKKRVKNAICESDAPKEPRQFQKRLLSTFKTFGNPNVWWLCFSWIHLGIMTGELLGVYSTALLFTESLQGSMKTVISYAIAISCGELTTALGISLLSRRFTKIGRIPACITASAIHATVCTLIFLSTPRYSSLYPNNDKALLIEPNFYIAMVVGYLLGVADGCCNAARSVIIPVLMPDQRAECFSISKAFQSFASCVIFFVATLIDLYGHFAIMIISNIAATTTFVFVTLRYDRMKQKELRQHLHTILPNEFVGNQPKKSLQ